MEFLSRLIGGVGSTSGRKTASNDPQQRLARFKKTYSHTLQISHKLSSSSKLDPVAVDTVRACLQRLTTLLHDDTRAPAPHLCLSFAASSQFYITVTRVALSLNNEDVVREAIAWFSALVDSDEDGLLNNEQFAEALVTFVDNVSGPSRLAVGSHTEGEILELIFGIAAKIRLEPEILPVWFLSEDVSEASKQDQSQQLANKHLPRAPRRRFPLCYQFIGHVYHEGRAGDFARTGLLYIFESVSHSPELERWIIESDLPTLMASGLGALYSQLSRKLDIAHPRDDLPLILALSDDRGSTPSSEVDSFYSEGLQARLSTFMSNLIFWQDILEHCRSLEIKQTLIDHFQVFFLQQILYPSLLESSDIDGGSSVAVLTYLWRILDSVDHPDLIHLILSYLLALSEPLQASPETPRTPHAQKARQSLISQIDGSDEKMNPSLFNLADLIIASVQSSEPETINAALRLTGVLLLKHHTYAHSVLMRTTSLKPSSAGRTVGSLYQDLNTLLQLASAIAGSQGVDEAYGNSLKDALGLIELHECSNTKLGLRGIGFAAEGRSRSAILEDNSRSVNDHHILLEDPLLQALMHVLRTFFTNDVETNLGLTNVIAHLLSCPHSSTEGWMTTDTSKYHDPASDTTLSELSQDEQPDKAENIEDLSKAEEARLRAFKAACQPPSVPTMDHSLVVTILTDLLAQLNTIRAFTPNLDVLITSRKRAFHGAQELSQQAQPPVHTPQLQPPATSRTPSRSRSARPLSPSKSSTTSTSTPRGRMTPSRLRPSSPLRNPAPSSGTLSPLAAAAVQHADSNEDEKPSLSPSAQSETSDTASLATEVFERKIKFPLRTTLSTSREDDGRVEGGKVEVEVERERENEDGNEKEVTLNHVLTNIVVLQEFVLEVAALVHVRAGMVEGEVRFL